MDSSFPGAIQKIYKKRGRFWAAAAACIGEGEQKGQDVSCFKKEEMIMKRATMANTLAIAVFTVLALGIAPLARADNKGCTNEMLKGSFVHTASGFETNPPAIAGPLVGVGLDTFDGKGGVTTTAIISLNGNIVPLTAAGTYKVNPDCTGTYSLPGTTLFFVIASGNEIHAICIDPGVILAHTFRRQFPVGD